ncbi:hypothetical protein C8F04DRAFT_1271042 [Mycena alexandri]|uniref:Protein kinase domain-containing protein n=1 Tax=Mycena alexandri TaxID=1745969 RepID=A0AAD6WWK9_9AGAR|nr:hypothetical protein C8F04DRAFT_1271042 [Mycena alexandri]
MSNFQPETEQSPSYWTYFSRPRIAPPRDATETASISYKHQGESLPTTTELRWLNVATLTHTTTLDLGLVTEALTKYGPVVNPLAPIEWIWDQELPAGVEQVIRDEKGLYHTSTGSSSDLRPARCPQFSTTFVDEQEFGSTDILQYCSMEGLRRNRTLHEVKRARVLSLLKSNVLDIMYGLAGSTWAFKQDSSACKRGAALLCQAIDELAKYQVRHIVLTTETHYALVHLDDDSQLCMSDVYEIRPSDPSRQPGDMAHLVLFYAHAALSEPLECSRNPVTTYRVEVPSFPPWIFRPYKGKICVGNTVRSLTLSAGKLSSARWIPPFIPLKVEGYAEDTRHEGDIRIIFVKLIFTIFQRSAVAKAAYGLSASARIVHELDVYNVLRRLQGFSIPTLFGLYRSDEEGSSAVLITSHEGTALHSFDDLGLEDRRSLMQHLVRIHQAGVEHHDVEPRNVVLSKTRGPIIVDFDGASLNHRCEGQGCGELREVAGRLGINLEGELRTRSKATSVAIVRILLWTAMVLMFTLVLIRLSGSFRRYELDLPPINPF